MARGPLSSESLYRLAERQVDHALEEIPDWEQRFRRLHRRRENWGNPHLIEVLLERSIHLARRDPAEGQRLLDFTSEVLRIIGEKGRQSRDWLMGRRGLIQAYRANAWRLQREFDAALAEMELAEQSLQRCGTQAIKLVGRVSSLKASLWSDLLQFEKAIGVLQEAKAILRAEGQKRELIKVHMKLQALHGEMGCGAKALREVEQASRLVPEVEDPDLTEAVGLNLVHELINLGRYREAENALTSAAEVSSWDQDRLLRRGWLQATIHQGLGRSAEARRYYLSIREGFLARRNVLDAFHVSLELAGLEIQQGSAERVETVAREMASLLEHRQVQAALHEEGRAALRHFLEAAIHRRPAEDLHLVAVAAVTGRSSHRR